jgi:hypothetical protein
VQGPPPALVPPPARSSVWIWLGPLVGVLVVGCFFAMLAFVRFCGRAADAGGVRVSNDIPAVALERLDKRKVLNPGEKVLAYYDATLGGTGSEVAIVTDERLVYLKDGRTTALALADIADVRHHSEPLVGDVIEAQADSGQAIKVEVPPLNDGDVFLSTLQTAWKKKRPAAAARPSAHSP